MIRFVAPLFAVAVLANAVRADIPPPPAPFGKKYVSVSHEVVVGKDVSGYVFVLHVSHGRGAPRTTHTKWELTVGKAVPIPVGEKYSSTLCAVPQDAAKAFGTDQELIDALLANKLTGVHSISFYPTETVSKRVLGRSVKWTHTITAIDPQNGIREKVEGRGAERPADKSKNKDQPDKKDQPRARAETWMAGGAAALAVLLGGFWLADRTRRKI